ncbi:MAG: NAD(+) synthase [Gammaproteobacteria bacterium]|nr:NAD(+) synthase [Gammaproteobacteria bacterium]
MVRPPTRTFRRDCGTSISVDSSNAYGAMPLSTGNKTESACGYYTHFDMNFSYAPIKDLYKFEVLGIARESVRIPDNIWQKPPSAELAPGQTDEASLLSYAVLDPIVRAYVEDYVSRFPLFQDWLDQQMEQGAVVTMDPAELVSWVERDQAPDDFERIISLMGKMEYKRRQTCPGTKVSRVRVRYRATNSDRREMVVSIEGGRLPLPAPSRMFEDARFSRRTDLDQCLRAGQWYTLEPHRTT